MNLYDLFIYHIPCIPMFTLIDYWMLWLPLVENVYEWKFMIDSLGMSGDPPNEELVTKTLVGPSELA